MAFLRAYLKKYKKLLIISLVLATVNQVFSLVSPQVLRIIIDEYANNIEIFTESEFIRWVGYWLLIWLIAAGISRIAKIFQAYYVDLMSEKIGAKIYADSIEHTFNLPYRVFESRQSGSLLDKLYKARQDIKKFLQSMINMAFLTTIWIIIVMIYGFYVHWLIWTTFLLMVPVLFFTTLHLSKRIRKSQQDIVSTSATLSGSTIENIKNVTLIKSLWLETQEITHLNNVNDQLIDLEIQKLKLVKTITFWQWTLISILRWILQFIMLILIFQGYISIWEFLTLMFYSFLLFNPLYNLPELATSYQEVKASNEILEEIHAMKQIAMPKNPMQIDTINNIQFDTVSFDYTKDETAIKDITFSVKKGQSIAFVWPSWAWKSTILKVLMGLYKPKDWSVKINGIDTKTIDPGSFKSRTSIVAQDTQLFSWTIRENLVFVAPNATDEECKTALNHAQLWTLLKKKQWLDLRIGEWWLKLSWWQKQRLAIARALLRNPDLLIFDEATSSLDSIAESKITKTMHAIAQKNKSLITITVAHRLSTIMAADRIYVLEEWQIVESWTHTQLVADKWLYYALRRQQGGKIV